MEVYWGAQIKNYEYAALLFKLNKVLLNENFLRQGLLQVRTLVSSRVPPTLIGDTGAWDTK